MIQPIDTTSIPADVRSAGPDAVKLYGAALQFENLLVQQLTQQMFDSTPALGDEGDEGSGGSNGGPYAAMLPTALSDSLTAGGGLGLASSLYQTMSAQLGLGAGPKDGEE
jgi:Rod binding domain-containing protein